MHGLPTVTDLQDAMATLEGGHAALAVPSGLTATTLPLLALAHPGDHVLVTDSVYGPTRRFCDLHMKRLGVDVTYYDPLLGADIARAVRAEHRDGVCRVARLADVRSAGRSGHRGGRPRPRRAGGHGQQWATPLYFRAFDHGVDVSVHAATKYIGGHSDVLLGRIVCSARSFRQLHRLWTDMGVTASSDDCFLGLRGLRTLAARLGSSRRAAQGRAMAARASGGQRSYPSGLPGARGHELWKRDFAGATSLFGVVLQPVAKERIDAMLDGMRLFGMGWSWGGFESLMIPIYPERFAPQRGGKPAGLACGFTIGLEDPNDLIGGPRRTALRARRLKPQLPPSSPR